LAASEAQLTKKVVLVQEIPLVTKFVELEKEVTYEISRGSAGKAKDAYSRLLEQYKQINESPLADIHKTIAYDQASKLYEQLSQMKTGARVSEVNASKFRQRLPGIALLVVLALLFAGAAIFKPGFIGLAVLENTQERSQIVGASFTEDSNYTITLDRQPLSLKLSGYLSDSGANAGTAKVYLLNGESKILVFDSSNSTTNSFESACADSCSLSGLDKTITLFIDIEGSTLTISKIDYTIDISSNQAPNWKGAGYLFNIQRDSEYRVNMNDYFEDADGDPLVFLSTRTDNLDVMVDGNIVTLKPYTGFTGMRTLTFVASDMIGITRVPVQVSIS